jgi:gas vesicle protein
MEERQTASDSTLKTLFLGITLGTILGFLFAPEKGEEVRKTIKGKVNQVMEEINTQGNDIRNTIMNEVDDIQENIDGKISDAKSKINRAKDKVAKDVDEEDI